MQNQNTPRCLLIAALSVDGFIAQDAQDETSPSTSWTSKEDAKHFQEVTKQVGTVVMGRKTYNTIGRPLPGRVNIVYSRDAGLQPQLAQTSQLEVGQTYFTSLPPCQLLSELGERGAAEVALCGGASLYSYFWQEGAVDQLLLTVEPVIFGQGVRLFGNKDIPQEKLQLQQVKQLSAQTVVLDYLVTRDVEDN